MGLSQLTAPYAEPMNLVEAKAHLRVDITDDDTYITSLIAQARRFVEAETHNQLVTATWLVTHRNLGRRKVLLPIAPAQSIDYITYIDFSGVLQTIATTVYQLLADRMPGVVVLGYLQIWPTTIRNQENDVKISYKAGYITPISSVDATGNTLTVQCTTFALGQVLRLSNSGGTLPGALATYTDYYVINPTNNGATFQLSLTSGGSAIDITTTGTGSNFVGVLPEDFRGAMLLLISHWYENREGATVGTVATSLPMGVDALLTHLRITEFE